MLTEMCQTLASGVHYSFLTYVDTYISGIHVKRPLDPGISVARGLHALMLIVRIDLDPSIDSTSV